MFSLIYFLILVLPTTENVQILSKAITHPCSYALPRYFYPCSHCPPLHFFTHNLILPHIFSLISSFPPTVLSPSYPHFHPTVLLPSCPHSPHHSPPHSNTSRDHVVTSSSVLTRVIKFRVRPQISRIAVLGLARPGRAARPVLIA